MKIGIIGNTQISDALRKLLEENPEFMRNKLIIPIKNTNTEVDSGVCLGDKKAPKQKH